MIFEEVLKHLYFPHPPPHKQWQCLSVPPQLSPLASAPVWAPVPANYGQTKMKLQNEKLMIIFCICMTQTCQFQATKLKNYYCNYSSVRPQTLYLLCLCWPQWESDFSGRVNKTLMCHLWSLIRWWNMFSELLWLERHLWSLPQWQTGLVQGSPHDCFHL